MTENTNTQCLIDLTKATHSPIIQVDPSPSILITKPNDPIDHNQSSDNNPFDKLERQVQLLNDPFEIVMKEEITKNMENQSKFSVQTDSLISFNDLSGNSNSSKYQLASPNPLNGTSRLSSVTSQGSDGPFSNDSSTLNRAFITDGSIQTSSNTSDGSSIMNRGFFTTSLANETIPMFDSPQRAFNYTLVHQQSLSAKRAPGYGMKLGGGSPTRAAGGAIRTTRIHSDSSAMLNQITGTAGGSCAGSNGGAASVASTFGRTNMLDLKRTELLRYSLTKTNSKQDDSVFLDTSSVSNRFANISLGSLADDSMGDLSSVKPPNWIDFDTDVDSDIEQMNIPFLECKQNGSTITTPKKKLTYSELVKELSKFRTPKADGINGINESISPDDAHDRTLKALEIDHTDKCPALAVPQIDTASSISSAPIIVKPLPSSAPTSTDNNLKSLMQNLQSMVEQCQNDNVKTEASALLQNLNNVLVNQQPTEEEVVVKPLVKRQGTFTFDESNETEINTEKSQLDMSVGPMQLHQPTLNVLQGDLNQILQNVATNNSTVILVMNQQQSQAPQYQPAAVQTPNRRQSMIRSNSLSSNVKPASAIKAVQAKTNNPPSTPLSSAAQRRKSFSSVITSSEKSPMPRRSIYAMNSPSKEIAKNTPSKPPTILKSMARKNALDLRRSMIFSAKDETTVPPTTNTPSKFKLKVGCRKPTAGGPLKAIVPLLKIAPSALVSPPDPSPIDNPAATFKTSTPLPVRCGATLLAACSTPTVELKSSLKSSSTLSVVDNRKTPMKKKSRVSFLSATPMTKSNPPMAPAVRRRTLSAASTTKSLHTEPAKVMPGANHIRSKLGVEASTGIQRFRFQSPLANKENKLPLRK